MNQGQRPGKHEGKRAYIYMTTQTDLDFNLRKMFKAQSI